jgi:hypothetical protein
MIYDISILLLFCIFTISTNKIILNDYSGNFTFNKSAMDKGIY